MVDWSIEPHRVPTLVGSVAMLLLAAWIFSLSPGSRVHRAFALFLTLRGSLGLLLASNDLSYSTEGWVIGYVAIALPLSALHLGNQVWVCRGSPTRDSWLRSPWVSWGLLGVAVVLELAYFVDHDLWLRVEPDGLEIGPLGYAIDALYPSYALLALVFALVHARMPREPATRRRAIFDLSLAFVLPPANACVFFLLVTIGAWSQFDLRQGIVYLVLNALGFGAVLATFAVWFGRAARSPHARGDALRYGALLAFAVGTGVLMYALMRARFEAWLYLFTGLGMLWTLVLVGLVAFAIVRYRFQDLDVRVRTTLSRGVVASALVAAFFVFSETATLLLGRTIGGQYYGIVATGALLFALAPLRRLGEKVAGAAMPEAIPMEHRTLKERLALYAEQSRIAWEDGALTAKERRLLDHVRQRLGLTDDQAAKLERDVLTDLLPERRPMPARLVASRPQAKR